MIEKSIQKCQDAKHIKTLALAEIIEERTNRSIRNLLVVGCGSGMEAGVLAKRLNAKTTGIDVNDAFDRDNAFPAELRIMDAQTLEFPDNYFDLLYSFHALEHMSNPQLALKEMARVLAPDGIFVFGTPNKRRLLGYLGSNTSLMNKFRWNLNDLAMRFRGQWSNEAGAHAGFSEDELLSICRLAFDKKITPITDEYYSKLYGDRLVRILKILNLKKFIYPCVYLFGQCPP